jgi:hypothetical protein
MPLSFVGAGRPHRWIIVLTDVTTPVLILTVLLSAATVYSQELPQQRNVTTLLRLLPPITNEPDFRLVPLAQAGEVPHPPEPPAGAAAWSLTIHTTGGFTGQGVGSVTLVSDGVLRCPSGCAAQVAASQLRSVSTTLASIVDAAWIRKTPSSFCRDCVQTTVVLKRREGDAVRTYIASWDDSQPATSELRELRRLVFELRGSGR